MNQTGAGDLSLALDHAAMQGGDIISKKLMRLAVCLVLIIIGP